jgi:hypothetical protein
MKHTCQKLAPIVLVTVVVTSTGCQKLIERIFPRPKPPISNGTGCQISSIRQDDRTGTFYYTDDGLPDSVIFDIEMGSAGAQLFYYSYDNHRRLVTFEAYYDRQPDNYYFKHKYVYSNNGKLLADTARIRQSGSWTQVTFPEFDTAGRIVRETGKVIEAEGDSTVTERPTLTYEYNADGNLISSPEISYDNKVSFISASGIFMFTERNYSKNNPVGATGYNQENQPLGFNGASIIFFQQGAPSEITYNCGPWDY